MCYRLTDSNEDKMPRGTYQSDFLQKRIPPFKDSKEELIASLRFRPFVIEFHHSGLQDPTEMMKLMLLR